MVMKCLISKLSFIIQQYSTSYCFKILTYLKFTVRNTVSDMLQLDQNLTSLDESVFRYVQPHYLAVELSLKHQLHLHSLHRHY